MRQNDLFISESNLFENVSSIYLLEMAFNKVKKNKGVPGIDGVTVTDFKGNLKEELSQLRTDLLNWTYKPSPVKRVEIEKPGGKGIRLLGIPTVRDRVVQAAIKIVLEPIFEPLFSENSFGFRPGRGQAQAVRRAQEIVQSGKKFTVDIDLAKYFDKINHDRVIHLLSQHVSDKRILKLIGMTLRSEVMVNGVVLTSEEGSVQGSPLSPLLSNVVLDELDKELERRNLDYCRFADDCNIFVGSLKAGKRVMESITSFIERKLKLKVNAEKSKVSESRFVKFLGFTIIAGAISISRGSIDRAMEKVKQLTPRGTYLPLEKSMENINKWYIGWSNYYSMTQYPAQLKKIEAHVRRRMRARIVKQQKRKKFLTRKLVRLGVRKRVAGKTVYSNKKVWVLSHTYAVEKAFSVDWFTNRVGQKIRSDRRLPHWFGIRKWIKLS